VEEVDTLNTLAWELASKEDMRSLELAERALRLSHYGYDAGQINRRGAALALRMLAHIDKRRFDFPAALPRLLEAMYLLETLDEPEALLTVMGDLGWVYFNLGDFPLAVEVLLKGLKIAHEQKFLNREVGILCSRRRNVPFKVCSSISQSIWAAV
jgi:hypothetical protein